MLSQQLRGEIREAFCWTIFGAPDDAWSHWVSLEQADMGEAAALWGALHGQHHVHSRRQLRVQRRAVQAAEGGESLHAGWYFKERIGVQRAGAAVVAGVERGEEIHHLAAADFAHHDAVRPHAQRLAQQL